MREPLAVGPVGRHRVVRVADEDDPRLERDLLARDAVGIAAPVPPLVTVADDLAHLLQLLDRSDDLLAELGVRLHDGALVRGQTTGLREDRALDADLADVVQERAELEPLQLRLVEPELAADAQRQIGDPTRVRRRVLVVGLERVRERLDRRDERTLEAFEVARVRDRKVRLSRETAEESALPPP